MTTLPAEDPLPEAGKLPTGRVARTARVGGLVTGFALADEAEPGRRARLFRPGYYFFQIPPIGVPVREKARRGSPHASSIVRSRP